MLATDPDLELRARGATLVDRDLHQPGDCVVQGLERVDRQDAVLDVLQQEPALGVVPAVTERHLRQVVRPEAEERRVAGDLVGREGAAWHLDHGAELVVDFDAGGVDVDYKFGTMIEVPRGALTADEIAREADFFSFGTNDLTQMTFGYSRDDAEGGFLLKYVEDKILPVNPFQTLDDAVAGLMKVAVDKGRSTKPDLELGICGEHGGDPESIFKCEAIGLDYVSCSPFRVPIARLAAAQAALGKGAASTA